MSCQAPPDQRSGISTRNRVIACLNLGAFIIVWIRVWAPCRLNLSPWRAKYTRGFNRWQPGPGWAPRMDFTTGGSDTHPLGRISAGYKASLAAPPWSQNLDLESGAPDRDQARDGRNRGIRNPPGHTKSEVDIRSVAAATVNLLGTPIVLFMSLRFESDGRTVSSSWRALLPIAVLLVISVLWIGPSEGFDDGYLTTESFVPASAPQIGVDHDLHGVRCEVSRTVVDCSPCPVCTGVLHSIDGYEQIILTYARVSHRASSFQGVVLEGIRRPPRH